LTQKAKKRQTSTDRLRGQIRKTNELYALNRINRTPVSIGNAQFGNFGGSAGGVQASQGNYLQISGGTMVGPIAYYPAVVVISSEEINIAPNTSSTPRNSSYVIVSFSSPAILSLISGASYAGQILLLQIPASSTLTIENYTSNVTGNIVTGDGNDIVVTTGSDPVVIQLQFDITISPNSNNGGWSVLYAKSISGSTATASFPLQGPVDARGLVSTNQNISLSDADGHVTTMTLDNSAAPSIDITFSNYPAAGKFMEWEVWITQDSTGGVSINWPAAVVNPPNISTTANTLSAVTFHTHDNGTTVYAVVIQNAAATSGNFATRQLNNLSAPVLNTDIDVNAHELNQVFRLTGLDAGSKIESISTIGYRYNIPTGQSHDIRVNNVSSLEIDSSLATFGVDLDLQSTFNVNNFGVLAQGGTEADAGAVRLINNVPVAWRNAGNTANITLNVGTNDAFSFNSDLDINGNYMDVDGISTPANPTSGTRRIFVDTADGVLKVRTSGGSSISLEGGGLGTHNLLDATSHPDAATGTVARGDLITGQGATPKFTRLAKGPANYVLSMDGTGTDIIWAASSSGGDLWSDPIDSAITTDGTPRAVGTSLNRLGNTFLTNLDVNTITVSGLGAFNGDVSLGNAAGDSITVNGTIGTNVNMGEHQINEITTATFYDGLGNLVGDIRAVNSSPDILEIRLGGSTDFAISDNGTVRADFNNTLLTWSFQGSNVFKLPQETQISDRSSAPSTPSSGQASLYVINSAGAQSLRVKFDNGTEKTITTDT